MISTQFREHIAASEIDGVWTFPDNPDAIPRDKGAYALALCLGGPVDLEINRTCRGRLMPGWYFYLGSARGSGGLAARLKRHFREKKKLHWHVDRLTVQTIAMAALAVPDGNECELADGLLATPWFKIALAGFGSTDCRRCDSHLLMAAPD
ncbi:GIY-YIG nuclease family protein [Roseibium sp. SCP14]|uniref:GIY-YIG nuclease family protein n=1 Tax=Roseibium sp. SCP14 TaxID=3141375 RepID=UPI0033382108